LPVTSNLAELYHAANAIPRTVAPLRNPGCALTPNEELVVCNHELRASSPNLPEAEPPSLIAMPQTNGRQTNGRRFNDDQSATRPGGPEMRLARFPTEPVRDLQNGRRTQQALRREACASAVADDRERIADDLYDAVIHRLFAAGLQLQATCQVVDGPAQIRLETTIDLLDATITELRKAIFSLH
jgi:signal transduction histidine kinase